MINGDELVWRVLIAFEQFAGPNLLAGLFGLEHFSIEAHRGLVEDGVLRTSVCTSPEDLSVLVDTVVEITASQEALVNRLPRDHFQQIPS